MPTCVNLSVLDVRIGDLACTERSASQALTDPEESESEILREWRSRARSYRAGQFHFGLLNSVEPSSFVSPNSLSR